ncbi:Uncharacterised protein [Actinobacillus equuli]|nr:Uncharacterised protein [Actinobacillus equuli]
MATILKQKLKTVFVPTAMALFFLLVPVQVF